MAQSTNIAVGTAAATGADIVVTDAAPACVGLFASPVLPLPTEPSVTIQRKDPNGNYRETGLMLSRSNPDALLNAIGTYRANRLDLTQAWINPASVAVGVMLDQ